MRLILSYMCGTNDELPPSRPEHIEFAPDPLWVRGLLEEFNAYKAYVRGRPPGLYVELVLATTALNVLFPDLPGANYYVHLNCWKDVLSFSVEVESGDGIGYEIHTQQFTVAELQAPVQAALEGGT